MALGTERNLLANFRGEQVAPCSLSSNWIDAIDAGGVATQDAASITNPDSEITAVTRHTLSRQNSAGTLLRLRLGYSGTPSADPVLAVFGRSGTDAWERLVNKSGGSSATLTTAASTDVTDGTLKYTAVGDGQTFDCQGCDELLVGVQTAFAGSATADAIVQAKII